MIETLAIHGYRSLREVVVPLAPITLVTGANGSGKSSLYRALRLLSRVAEGGLVGSLAAEGGLQGVLWAGPETISGAMRRGEVPVQGTGSRRAPVSLMLGFATGELGYLVDVGLPVPGPTMFTHDPVIKREEVFVPPVLRPAGTLVTRAGARVETRDGRSSRLVADTLDSRASMVGEIAAADECPELHTLRTELRGWRFHDSFRVDTTAPARQPHVGTWTPVLSDDGADLAPAVQTILESAWRGSFEAAVQGAFPGSSIAVDESLGLMSLHLRQPGLLRALSAAELSDGTLRFLLLATALLSPRPPTLLVLNEPESSLHPDLLPALADLVLAAAQHTQVIVVSHATALAERLLRAGGDRVAHHTLVKNLGETTVEGQGLLSRPQWQWGRR